MSYQSEVLADLPALFFRLDQIGAATNGDEIADLSGNDLHGTLSFSGASPTQPYGYASPIETDPASRAFFCNIISPPLSQGIISRASDPLIEPDGDLSLEIWVKPLHVVTSFVTKRKIFDGICFEIRIDTQGALVGSLRDTGGTVWNVTAPGLGGGQNERLGQWWHVVLVRQGATLALYVNGYLKASTTITSGLPTLDEPGEFRIHGGASGGFQFYVDEVALYDHALSAARVLIHYEAAKNTLPLSATITVRVVVELDTDQVIPIDFPFTHNFAEAISGSPRPLVEHLSYATNVLQSEPDYQQRINAQPHHAERTLEYFVTPTSARARAMMQAVLWTPGQTYKLPIAKDWGALTAQATAGAGTLSLDTTLKDYEIGSYVVVWEDVREPWTAQFFLITSRTDSQLGITPNVGSTLPLGSTVMPSRLAILPEDTLSIDSHLIDRETAALQFEILSTELSSRRVTAYTPSETYLSIEVFRFERAKVEWVDPSPYQIARRQQGTGNSAGNDYLRAIDTGSPQTVPIRVLLASEEAISEFYGWMDARQGKVNPVWVISEENDLEVIARTNTTITVSYIGYAARYNVHSARRHIAFKKTDGSTVFKKITAAVDNGNGTETLSVASPPAFADIVKASFLKFCTAPDQFELKYHRNGTGFIGECEFVMTELLTTPAA